MLRLMSSRALTRTLLPKLESLSQGTKEISRAPWTVRPMLLSSPSVHARVLEQVPRGMDSMTFSRLSPGLRTLGKGISCQYLACAAVRMQGRRLQHSEGGERSPPPRLKHRKRISDPEEDTQETSREIRLLARKTLQVFKEIVQPKRKGQVKKEVGYGGNQLKAESAKEEGEGGEGKSDKGAAGGASAAKGGLLSDQGKATIMRVLKLIHPERRVLGLAVGTIFVTTPISLILPMAVGKLLDVATSADPVVTPVTVAGALLAVFTVQGLMMSVRDGLLSVAGERMAARLRNQTFASVMRQDMSFFDSVRTGELINRLASDTAVIQKAITNNVTNALRSVGMVVGCSLMLVFTSPKLSLVSLLVLPPGGIIAVYLGRFMKRKQADVQEALAETSQHAEEVFTSIRTVRQFARESDEVAKYMDQMARTRELATSVGIANSLLGTSVHMAANMSLACVLGYGGTLVVAGEMTAGVLTSFLLYSVYVGYNVGNLSGIYGDLMKAVGASQRIFDLLDRQPGLPPYDCKVDACRRVLDDFKGGIEFKDVTFTYPTRPQAPILNRFTLKIEPGQVVGIVGASGSGKSTVGMLLTRLYDPQDGSVLLDGVDLKDLSCEWVRSQVAAVPQEPVLFAVSIADNIRYGKLDATDEEIRRVAEIANAHQFIEQFPEGYDTYVGERGLQLSGGQKQRLAIARALLKYPKILLLDEATSALDSESERLVQQAFNRVEHSGVTVVKIAHRLNTIKDADMIVVVEKGRVAEVGTYNELIRREQGAFATLIASQTQ